jgi:hypothetical protein
MRILGLSETDRLPKYPGCHVTPAPDNYRPLKPEEIQDEDIKMFKQKVKLVRSPYSEQLLAGYKVLKEYYQQRENKFRTSINN